MGTKTDSAQKVYASMSAFESSFTDNDESISRDALLHDLAGMVIAANEDYANNKYKKAEIADILSKTFEELHGKKEAITTPEVSRFIYILKDRKIPDRFYS